MGNQKQKWTPVEEAALFAGVKKHGAGKWKIILRDPEFSETLVHRSNIDLKDKWRNVNMSTMVVTKGSKEKHKVKPSATPSKPQTDTPVASHALGESTNKIGENCLNIPQVDKISGKTVGAGPKVPDDGKTDSAIVRGQPISSQDGTIIPRYSAMIFEALSTIKDRDGSGFPEIARFIQQKHTVPQNFRRPLSSALRRLVLQGKLEKVGNSYKVKTDSMLEVEMPPEQYDVKPRRFLKSVLATADERVKKAAMDAAGMLAYAESRSDLAALTVKKAEIVSKVAEDTESLLLLATEIYEQCSRGEVVILA